ncbi:MAG TPA: sulfatase [Vicinamibacteria bacterium]|nr:sulfatase [Vicinamibacteria bacterium]
MLVVTDDLDLASAELLPRLPIVMDREGVSFSRAYVTTALCAPSRASILTGQYAHNHGLVYNEPPGGGFPTFRGRDGSTIATWLKAGGYRTALVGKYLNGYPRGAPETWVPPGWDEWFAHLSDLEAGRYYGYWMNDNGEVLRYGERPDEYNTDVLAGRAVEYIEKSAGRSEPFFLYVATEAPHAPAIPAGRHSREFPREGCARGPSFNEGDVRDKPAWVRGIPPMTGEDVRRADSFQRGRLRSMRAVEDLLERVLVALAETRQLENTYVVFTSDNGLLMGQHRAVGRKNNHYEESIHVPLVVRGPGVPAGRRLPHPVLNIDLAPTLCELARIPVPDTVDGRSLAPLLRQDPPGLERWRSDFLVEHFSSGTSWALRTPDVLYGELESGELELYDMVRDPYQVDSQHRKVDPAVLEPYSRRIAALAACRAATCRN